MLGIYFSGTGNTKFCLEVYLSTLYKSARMCSIEDKDALSQLEKEESIILAYPIYYSNLPKILQDFLHGTSSLWKGKHVFILTTMGLFSGDGAGCAARLLSSYGATVVGGLHVKMPDCIGDEKLLKKSLEKNKQLVHDAEQYCQKAALAHLSGKPYQQGLSFLSHMLGLFGQRLWFSRKTSSYSNQLTIHSDVCVGCGTCASSCPMKNIHIIDGKAISGKNCTMCYRCVNHCPVQAITLLGKTVHEQSLLNKYR